MLLIATAVMFNHMFKVNYLFSALQKDPTLLNMSDLFTPQQIADIGTEINIKIIISSTLAWTTIFLVKFSFLAFFRSLTEQIYNIYVYFWVVVVITLFSWMVVLVEPFIVCPYFGLDSGLLGKPFSNQHHEFLTFSMK